MCGLDQKDVKWVEKKREKCKLKCRSINQLHPNTLYNQCVCVSKHTHAKKNGKERDTNISGSTKKWKWQQKHRLNAFHSQITLFKSVIFCMIAHVCVRMHKLTNSTEMKYLTSKYVQTLTFKIQSTRIYHSLLIISTWFIINVNRLQWGSLTFSDDYSAWNEHFVVLWKLISRLLSINLRGRWKKIISNETHFNRKHRSAGKRHRQLSSR